MRATPGRAAHASIALAVFAIAAALYTALGMAVSHAGPAGIDVAARGITGEAPQVASILTASCLWPAMTAFGLAGAIVATRVTAWRARIVFAIVLTLVTWQTSNVLKDAFARPRPAYWIVHHETTFAYSSGHAMFAAMVYWLWAYHATQMDLPRAVRAAAAFALAAWGAGVIWSRLALGAHYPTDLLGGLLLALAMLSLGWAIAVIFVPRVRVM